MDGDEERHHASVAVRAGARSGGARQSSPDYVGRPWWRIGFCATEVHVGEADLLSAEEALVSGTHRARRSEFATGRSCARHALDQVGAPQHLPLLADERGAPRWPAGFVGSITHTHGWTGAVAARAGRRRGVRSVGLDAETAAPLPPGVLDVIATRREQDEHERLVTLDPATPWDTVLFAAKEATYKAWYPLTGTVLDHDAVGVHVALDGRFTSVARASVGSGARRSLRVRGRWALGSRVVVSLAVVD